MKKIILNLSFLGLAGVLVTANVNAAPTVKKFGTSNTVRTTATTGVKSDGSNLSRVSSVRPNTAKPVVTSVTSPTKISSVKTSNATGSSLDTTNESRLSLGKYLHSANVNKTGTSGGATVASGDLIKLETRVDAIEEGVATVTQNVDEHTSRDDLHVTDNDKKMWNAKQDKLTPDGSTVKIDVDEDGNNVISSVVLLPVGGKDEKPSARMWIE